MISFDQQKPEARRIGRVVSRDGRNYVIEKSDGGWFPAEADTPWPVNARVIVVAGVIIGRAGAARTAKVFQV